MNINDITTIEDWYEHRDLVIKILNKMQWEFKHELQKMARNLEKKHKEIQIVEHEASLRQSISLDEKAKNERKIFISMLKSFNQQMLIARLTNMGKT